MCMKKMAFLSLVFLVCLINFTTAREAKQTTFTGRVIDANGQPIAGAKVKLYDEEYIQTIFSYDVADVIEATSNADGEFSFSQKTESDNYPYGYIVVEKEGLALDCTEWNMREDKEFEFRLGRVEKLVGTVVDENGKLVSKARVSILILIAGKKEDQHRLSINVAPKILNTGTDAEGKFSFTNLPANATVEFLVQKTGKATISTFRPGTYPRESLQFSPGQENIRITQPTESRIEGVVVDKDSGQPVAGVKLLIRQGQNNRVYGQDVITSGDDGAFSINELSAGSYILMFATPREGLAEWVAQPVNVMLEVDQTKKDVKIELSKGGMIEALVTEAGTNKPLEGARVYLYNDRNSQSFNDRSDKKGIARIRLLPGVYRSTNAYMQGYSSARQQDTITVEEGTTKHLEWQLTPLPTVTGIVRDENGKPIKGAKLGILPGGSRGIESDAEGRFEVSWDWNRLSGEQREAPLLVCRYEKGNLATVAIIDEGTKTVDVKLLPGVTVTGKVVDPNGQSIADARIGMMLRQTMWASTMIRSNSIKTDAEGNFDIKAIPAEHRYELNVSADGYGSERMDIHADDAVNNHLNVETITLPVANLTISGIVVDTQGNPVANARLESYNYESGQPERLITKTDSQGKFTLDGVCEGKINIRVNVNRAGKRLSARAITDGGATGIKIVAREGQPVVQYLRMKSYEKIIQSGEKVIAGVAVDENDSPVAGVPVGVRCIKREREDGKFSWTFSDFSALSDTTDKQGRFAIELEEDAQYNLRFSPDNHAALIVYDIPVGKKDLKVILPEGGTITGRLVRMENGKKIPIPNVEVKLEQEERASYTHLGFDRDRTAITDSQGRFQFVNVQTKIRPHGSMSQTEWEHIPRVWLISYGDTSKSIAFYNGTTIDDFELLVNSTEERILTGISLPGFDGIKINLAEEQAKGKRMLVCFWDMNQRPSRNCIMQLSKKVKELKAKDIIILTVQASKVEQAKLDEWIKDNNIPFPVGMIQNDVEKTLFTWGVKALPWLILTDKNHVVSSNGFSLGELENKIQAAQE